MLTEQIPGTMLCPILVASPFHRLLPTICTDELIKGMIKSTPGGSYTLQHQHSPVLGRLSCLFFWHFSDFLNRVWMRECFAANVKVLDVRPPPAHEGSVVVLAKKKKLSDGGIVHRNQAKCYLSTKFHHSKRDENIKLLSSQLVKSAREHPK